MIGWHGNTLLSEWGPHTCTGNRDCCDVPADGDICWQPLTPADAGLVRVERNFMHHNARDEGGYGLDVNGGAYVTVMGNVFNFNRHAVAATGMGHSGYVARFNYVLQGGYHEGGSWTGGSYNQHFDVHGEGDGGYGGPGGTYFEIAFNTVRGDQGYYVTQTRPAFMQRGIPAEGVDFHDNVLVHGSLSAAVRFKGIGLGVWQGHQPWPRPDSMKVPTTSIPTTPAISLPVTLTATVAPMCSSRTAPPGSFRAPGKGLGSFSTPPPSGCMSLASPISIMTRSQTCFTAMGLEMSAI